MPKCLDRCITNDEHDRLHKEFMIKIEDIDSKLENLQKLREYYLNISYLLLLANKAYELFASSEVEEKRQLLKLLL